MPNISPPFTALSLLTNQSLKSANSLAEESAYDLPPSPLMARGFAGPLFQVYFPKSPSAIEYCQRATVRSDCDSLVEHKNAASK
ncbi:MAG: hypothetical protein ABF308_00180, partial [Phaeobacter gallaeciensis]